MSIRTRLIITFIAIIVLVAAIMGLYQSYLLNSYFKQNEAQAMTSQAQQLRILIRNLHIYPQEALIIDIAAWAGSLANARVLITDNKGKVLIDSAGQSSLVDENLPTSLLSGTLSQGIIDSFDFPQAGKDWVAVSVPWITGNRITGALILIRPLDETASQTTREAAVFLLRAGLVASLVAGLTAYFLSNRIVNPIEDMASVAGQISTGDFRQRLKVDSNDELGQLAKSINTMSEEISNLVGKLTSEKEKLAVVLEERKNIISDISHDLRTPITSIRGFIEALRDGIIQDEEERKRVLGVVHDEAERLSRLINDLFYLVRLETGDSHIQFEPVDLVSVVEDAADKISPMLGQNQIALHIDIDQDLDKTGANITGSKDRLTQALLNLLDNAIKYSPEGSAVHLGIRRRGDYADMYVRDQGQGIPEEDIPHIFNRFYRADKSRSRAKAGTGLGLAIVKFVAEQHGGSVEVESVPGKGTTFYLSIPLSQ